MISKAGAAHEWWKRNQAPQFLKILITYFQVREAGQGGGRERVGESGKSRERLRMRWREFLSSSSFSSSSPSVCVRARSLTYQRSAGAGELFGLYYRMARLRAGGARQAQEPCPGLHLTDDSPSRALSRTVARARAHKHTFAPFARLARSLSLSLAHSTV